MILKRDFVYKAEAFLSFYGIDVTFLLGKCLYGGKWNICKCWYMILLGVKKKSKH